jgi:hypothetical protein
VHANVSLPSTFGDGTGVVPDGGIRLRVRAPRLHAGKLRQVTVGGKPWIAFDAATETIDFSKAALSNTTLVGFLTDIIATFDAAAAATPLRAVRVNLSQRVVPAPPKVSAFHLSSPKGNDVIPRCPNASTFVDSFHANGTTWAACEDLQLPGGDIVLLSARGDAERFSKSFAPYSTNWTDDVYYLGLGKAAVANATSDILGEKLLQDEKTLSWSAVERAVPVIRSSGKGESEGSICGGIRTFVGSRGASVDVAMDDHGNTCQLDANVVSYAINMHNKAVGAPTQTSNASITADGSVGDILPTAIFYLPMQDVNSSINRYWTYLAVPVPDICPQPAHGCHEQNVMFRLQQLECAGPNMRQPCKLVDWPMYWDSYWYSRFPGANASDTQKQTLLTGPLNATSSSEFYSALLASKKWWIAELNQEGMMQLHLPSPRSTNGTWLELQARQAIVRSMM